MTKFFDGYKSYLGAGLIALAAVLEATGTLPTAVTLVLHKLGLSLLGVGLAHKLQKLLNGESP